MFHCNQKNPNNDHELGCACDLEKWHKGDHRCAACGEEWR